MHIIYRWVFIEVPDIFYDAYNSRVFIRISYQCYTIWSNKYCLWEICFFPLNLCDYAFKEGQLSLELYLNIIKSGDLVPSFSFLSDTRLQVTPLLSTHTDFSHFTHLSASWVVNLFQTYWIMVGNTDMNRDIFIVCNFSHGSLSLFLKLGAVELWWCSSRLLYHLNIISGYEKVCCDWINEYLLE